MPAQREDSLVPREWIIEPDHQELFRSKDLRAVAWAMLQRLYIGDVSASDASAAATMIRALTALGDAPADEDEQLRIIALHGTLMNGFQPRDEDEWALAERVFGPERIAEFRRWRKLPPRRGTR